MVIEKNGQLKTVIAFEMPPEINAAAVFIYKMPSLFMMSLAMTEYSDSSELRTAIPK